LDGPVGALRIQTRRAVSRAVRHITAIAARTDRLLKGFTEAFAAFGGRKKENCRRPPQISVFFAPHALPCTWVNGILYKILGFSGTGPVYHRGRGAGNRQTHLFVYKNRQFRLNV
jgi:hypothetical protein